MKAMTAYIAIFDYDAHASDIEDIKLSMRFSTVRRKSHSDHANFSHTLEPTSFGIDDYP